MVEKCPKCRSLKRVKAGFKGQKQRYRCKDCGCFYSQSAPKGASLEVKRQAIQLYLEGLGFRAIGRLLKFSHVAVQVWIRELGEKLEELKPLYPAKVQRMELDEIHHYVGNKKTPAGFGLLLTVYETNGSTLKWAGVIQKPEKNSGRK